MSLARPAGWVSLVGLLLGSIGCATVDTQPLLFQLSGQGRSVAVLEFVDPRDAAAKELLPSPSARLREKLVTGLAAQGYAMVDTARLDQVRQEQTAEAGEVNPEMEAVAVGRATNSQVVVIGSLMTYDRPIYPKARLNLLLRVVDVERGTASRALEVKVEKTNWLYPPNLHEDIIDLAVEGILQAVRMGS